MKRYFIFFTLLSVAFFVVNAQNTNDNSLSRLKTQCHQVVELENSITSKQTSLNEINNNISNLRKLWMEICVEFLNDPNSTSEDFVDLLAETDINEEGELYKDLEWAKEHPSMDERRSRPQNNDDTKKPSPSRKPNKDALGSDVKGGNTQPKDKDHKDANADSKVVTDDPAPNESDAKNDSKVTKDDKKEEVPVKVENSDKKKEDITKKTEESSGQDKGSIVRNRKNKTGNP